MDEESHADNQLRLGLRWKSLAVVITLMVGACHFPAASAGLNTGMFCPAEVAERTTTCIGVIPATSMSANPDQMCLVLLTGAANCQHGGRSIDYLSTGAVQASAGKWHACFLMLDGNVQCFGEASEAKTADYTGGDAVAVSAGGHHTCVLRSNGNVFCYGRELDSTVVYTGGNAIAVSTAEYATCILLSSKNVRCYGGGPNSPSSRDYSGGDAIAVSAGGYDHGERSPCVVRTNGNVRCYSGGQWADYYSGGNAIGLGENGWHLCILLNDGDAICSLNPVVGEPDHHYRGKDAVAVDGGAGGCVLTRTGSVHCAWPNHHGYKTAESVPAVLRPAPGDFRSDNTIHVSGIASVRFTAEARPSPTFIDQVKATTIDRLVAAAQPLIERGDLLPLLQEILDLQTNPPPVVGAIHGRNGIIETWSRTDGPRTAGCYGIENHSGAFDHPLQICSPFLP